MPLTALSGTILENKSARPGYASLLLVTFTQVDGTVTYFSTSYNNSSLQSLDYNGNHYLCRVLEQNIAAIQERSQSGIDIIPSCQLVLADPDRFIKNNFELPPGAGFRGAIMELTFLYHQIGTSNFTSDSSPRFYGFCGRPYWDNDHMVISATSIKNPQNVFLPLEKPTPLCSNSFPANVIQQTAGLNDPSSPYWRCGYSASISGGVGNPGFTSCTYDKAACQARGMYDKDSSGNTTRRFSGTQWNPPSTFTSVSYTQNQVVKGYNSGSPNKYNQRYSMLWGTGWVDCIILNSINDGNSQRGEFAIITGNAGYGNIIQVNCDDNELPNASTGGVADALYRFNQITSGDRTGNFTTDAGFVPNPGGTPLSDPYGGILVGEYCVPSELVGPQSIPRIRALLTGPAVRYYTSPTTYTLVQHDPLRGLNPSATYTQDGGLNPCFAIMDILIKSNWLYSDLDIATFVTFAATCDTSITHTDITGATEPHCRYSLSFLLPSDGSTRDLGSILQNLLRGFNASINPNPQTGLLQIYIRTTLGDQQPAAIEGSNYNTAIASTTGTGAARNGYIAWHFNDSNILRLGNPPNEVPSIKQLPSLGSDIPTNVTVPFQDSENQWVADSYSVIDTQSLPYNSQQQIQSQSFQVEGVGNFDQIGRVVRTYFYEQSRGNAAEDPRGTDVYELQTTHETNHLIVGHLVWLTHLRDGISQQLFRISKISYAKDARTITYNLTWHDDNWYLDNNTTLVPPVYSNPGTSSSLATCFPWKPDAEAPNADGPATLPANRSFAIALDYSAPDNNGNITPVLDIRGFLPVNVTSPNVQPPLTQAIASVNSTGGFLLPNNYVFAFATQDNSVSPPQISGLGNIIHATVPTGAVGAQIIINRFFFPAASSGSTLGYYLYGGTEKSNLTLVNTGGLPGGGSITVDAIPALLAGPPDPKAALVHVQARRTIHSGVWALPIIAVATGSFGVKLTFLTVGDARAFSTNQYQNCTISLQAQNPTTAAATLPIVNYTIASNDGISITITSATFTFNVGDTMVCRSRVTSTNTSFTDTNYVNSVYAMADADCTSLHAFISQGVGAGQERTISSNAGGTFYISKPWDVNPTSASIILIVEPTWTYDQYTSPFNVTTAFEDRSSLPPIVSQIDLTNYSNQSILVRCVIEDANKRSGLKSQSPTREIWVAGQVAPSIPFALGPITHH